MFELTLLLLRAITMACRGHHDVVLENRALRHLSFAKIRIVSD